MKNPLPSQRSGQTLTFIVLRKYNHISVKEKNWRVLKSTEKENVKTPSPHCSHKFGILIPKGCPTFSPRTPLSFVDEKNAVRTNVSPSRSLSPLFEGKIGKKGRP
jgi:hypothetical protein